MKKIKNIIQAISDDPVLYVLIALLVITTFAIAGIVVAIILLPV